MNEHAVTKRIKKIIDEEIAMSKSFEKAFGKTVFSEQDIRTLEYLKGLLIERGLI